MIYFLISKRLRIIFRQYELWIIEYIVVSVAYIMVHILSWNFLNSLLICHSTLQYNQQTKKCGPKLNKKSKLSHDCKTIISLAGKAVLLDGDSAQRCIDELNNYLFRGQRLSVSLASCDFMLCVTQLPLTYSYDQFVSLITPFGTPERCFLVHR